MTKRWPVFVVVGLLLGLAGCGEEGAAPSQEQRERARAAGFDIDLVYVTEVDGYQAVAGGSGVYGDAGYQGIYASAQGDDLRLTVEHGSIDASTCAALPIPGATSADTTVTCTQDGDGWRRESGDRQEYALTRGEELVRVSGTSADVVRSAAQDAHPAGAQELDAILPPDPDPEIVERGDITGDNAPDNSVGAGG
ncbi:hypothetical protein [Kineosporia sp. NBRC 101731]|uniref:hypothetical protein n=1 Tax=Kineosporia sp. NBRC 101731 TaxID=3032199 RepID=UPI002554F227|nr:hypothetical protein [Kineosporia sp. NBRC 101731]